MIVRDEAGVLEECLDALRGFADDICVVDTGSVDDTPEIAARYGCQVGHFVWCDDFAEARNESLRLCAGDWIFVVDADERLDPADWARLRDLPSADGDQCYRFVTRNYTNNDGICDFVACSSDDPHARGFSGWYPSCKVRLFPNRRGIRFDGKVHELVNVSLESAGLRIVESDIPVHHYPLLHEAIRIQTKCEMYIRLGLAKLAQYPNDPKAYAELGNQYAELKDYRRAAEAYRNALRFDPENADVLSDLGGMLHLLGQSQAAARALDIATRLNPDLFQAWRNLGVVHAAAQEWAEAASCFETAMTLNPAWREGWRYRSVALEGSGEIERAAEALMNVGNAQAFADAGMLYYRLGDSDKATRAYRLGLQHDPGNEEIQRRLSGAVE
jgi:glycosyltransferase involved in cell wall biosynthesis